MASIHCPNCGSVDVRSVKQDEYKCTSCGAKFTFIRQDIQKYDIVTHNCPRCGKAIAAGKGNICVRCGKFDLCNDCVELLQEENVCKQCIKDSNRDCKICGNTAQSYCSSCFLLHDKGKLSNPKQYCWNHELVLHFRDYDRREYMEIITADRKPVLYCEKCALETHEKIFGEIPTKLAGGYLGQYICLDSIDRATSIEFGSNGIIIKCPYCGAPKPQNKKESQVICSSCGQSYIVPNKILDLL